MAWAALARKVQNDPVKSAEPKAIVYATEDSDKHAFGNLDDRTLAPVSQRILAESGGGSDADDGEEGEGGYARHLLPDILKGVVVLDTNAFIKGIDDFLTAADVFVTTPAVIAECRDRQTKDFLDRFPVKVTILEPFAKSVAEVTATAARTGDLGALSRTDTHLCALALELSSQMGKRTATINTRPARINDDAQSGGDEDSAASNDNDDDDADPAYERDDSSEEEEAEAEDAGKRRTDIKLVPTSAAQKSGGGGHVNAAAASPSQLIEENDDWGSDDDDADWITPDNIRKVDAVGGDASALKAKARGDSGDNTAADIAANDAAVPSAFEGGFACVTGDFPMQNVLLHLGVPVCGPRGMTIRQLRSWLLRCHACGRLVPDTTRQFCPDCGSGDTLKRVCYALNPDGSKHLFINFKKRITTRGTVFNLPKPRGGRRGTNKTLVLREDQLRNAGARDPRQQRQSNKRGATDGDGDGGEFDLAAFGDAPKRTKFDGSRMPTKSSYGRRNVNELRKARAARKR